MEPFPMTFRLKVDVSIRLTSAGFGTILLLVRIGSLIF